MSSCRQYLDQCRAKLGDPKLSDEKLGEALGYQQTHVNRAKRGTMSDPMAMAVARLLGLDPGEVLLVARAEREKDPAVSAALLAYVGKVLGTAQQTAQLAAEGWRKR